MSTPSPFPSGSLVAAYLRDSGGDKQDLSIDQQEQAIRAWCEQNHLVISQIFRDIHRTGTSISRREGFEEMISYFRQQLRPPESGLVLWKFSRFARNLDDAQFYKADLRRRGFIVHSITDALPEGVDGRFFESAYDWMNVKFIEGMRLEAIRGLYYIVENGAMPGTPPRGFKQEPMLIQGSGGAHKVHKWVPDPETWDRCKIAWEMRAAGASYAEINEKTRLYKSMNCWPTFFSNKIYLGELSYGSRSFPGYVKPMIDQATWDKVQDLRRHHIRRNSPVRDPQQHPRAINSDFLLSGLIHCANCGSLMFGNSIQSSKTGLVHKYYTCGKKTRERDCISRKVPKDAIELSVINECIEHVLESSHVKQLLDGLDPEDHRDLDMQIETMEHLVASTEKSASRLVDAIAVKGHSQIILNKLSGIEADLEEQRSQLRKLQGQKEVLNNYDPSKIQIMAEQLGSVLRNAGHQEKKDALQMIIEKVIVERAENKIIGQIIFRLPSDNGCINGAPKGKHFIQPFMIILPGYDRHPNHF
jgi:DNA invertase Pin-like site-specific DNA recombinase